MKRTRFPAGWDEDRVRRVLEHYESQTGNEAAAEDEAAFRLRSQTLLVVPKQLVPKITRLIAGERTASKTIRQPARKTRRG